MAIQRQVNNLRCGDIVVMVGYNGSADSTGYVVDTNPDTWDEPAVLIQFMGRDTDRMPLHYYHHELDDYVESGEIRIQHG